MQKQLEDYYAQKKSLDEGATASNIAEYNKAYLAWKKLQDKIDSKKALSTNERKKYNEYRKLLDSYADEKAGMITHLESCISYYKELVSLYDSFNGDRLVKILRD